jgi:cyclopropane fatty-acyl-phospholipid synthase-like methyltransferase
MSGGPNHPDVHYFKEHYRESVERMFAAVSDLYAQYWNDFFHFAIFEDGEESWESAFQKTHQRYLDALKVSRAQRVLELGCGRGGFSNILAQHTPGTVLGIDLSRAQLSHTKRFNHANLRFKLHDIMHVDDLAETFDAVACLDAAFYLPDKALAIARLSKVVAPGGRVLLVDWCRQEGLSAVQEELVLHPFMRYWGAPSLETIRSYERIFRHSGFSLLEVIDLNELVRRNWEFGYQRALAAITELSINDAPRLLWKGIMLGSDGVRLMKEQFPAALYIRAGFDTGFLRYAYFLAERQGRRRL